METPRTGGRENLCDGLLLPQAQNASASCPIFPHGRAERHSEQRPKGGVIHFSTTVHKRKRTKKKSTAMTMICAFIHGAQNIQGTEAQGKAGKTPRRSFLEGGFRGMLSRFPARFPDMLKHEQHARKRGGGNRMLPVRYGVRWQSAARHRFVRESQANARRRAFCANRKAASLPPHSKKT